MGGVRRQTERCARQCDGSAEVAGRCFRCVACCDLLMPCVAQSRKESSSRVRWFFRDIFCGFVGV